MHVQSPTVSRVTSAVAFAMLLGLQSGSADAQSPNPVRRLNDSVSAALSAQAPTAPAETSAGSLFSFPGGTQKKPAGSAPDNPYGMEALWNGSDLIARFVLLLLAVMSVGSWYILIVKLLEQTRMKRYARTVGKRFWPAKNVPEGVKALEKNSGFRFIAECGAAALTESRGLKRHIPMDDWVPMAIASAVDFCSAVGTVPLSTTVFVDEFVSTLMLLASTRPSAFES